MITDQERRDFWERFGLHKDGNFWYTSEGKQLSEETSPITLDNLFLYAVPQLVKEGYEITVRCYEAKWSVSLFAGKRPFTDVDIEDVDDPADALYQARKKYSKEKR